MLSLAELCKAIDKYATLAQNSYPLYKRAKLNVESPVYDRVSEEIFDSLSDEDFANLFETYLKRYEDLVNSLQIDPKEFGKILGGGETENDNFADLLSPFEEAYNDLVESPYLQQGIQSEDWQEGSTPEEINNGIEALAKDVWNRIYALGKSIGLGQSAVRGALEERQNTFENEVQGKSEQAGVGGNREGAGTGGTVQEQEYRNRKIERAKEYGKTHRRRRSEGLSVGEEALEQQIADLQAALAKETNGIVREDLGRRLQHKIVRLNLVNTYRAQQAREMEKLRANPAAYQAYVEQNTNRKASSRAFNYKFFELVNKLEDAGPNDQARIKAELVRLKKELMQRQNPKLDFDSPRAMYDTKVQYELNPDKIIADYSARAGSVERAWKKQHGERQKNRALGNLKGLTDDFAGALASDKIMVMERLDKELFLEDPRTKTYMDAINAAKKAKNAAAVRAAWTAYHKFLKGPEFFDVKASQPIFQEFVKQETAMKMWIVELKKLVKSGAIEKGTPDAATAQTVKQSIQMGKAIVSQYTRNASLIERGQAIIKLLEGAV